MNAPDKNSKAWPVLPGTYQVGNPNGPVAVCVLTSERLIGALVGLPGVAIAGMVYTANLGITRIIVNITTNPAIRFLLICGKDSALFRPGQSLVALAESGVDNQRRIIGAAGYDPVLPSVDPEQVARFRKQVEVLDWTGEEDFQVLKERINSLSDRNPCVFESGKQEDETNRSREQFVPIRPGGQRETLLYDPKGYFVITVEPEQKEILLRHYLPDHTPAHEMRGRGATSMLLGLLRDGLVTQLSHAGYLGEELAKAQTALQFGLRYDQDRLLRPRESPADTTSASVSPQAVQEKSAMASTPALPSKEPRIQVFTAKQLRETTPGKTVDLFLTVTGLTSEGILEGGMLEPDETGTFTAFNRTTQRLEVQSTPTIMFIMGTATDVTVGALLRVVGRLDENKRVHAEQLVILTKVARIL